jgi:hypothetical protein
VDAGVEAPAGMKFAVVPSAGRPVLVECIKAIWDQVDKIIVIDTGDAESWLPIDGEHKLSYLFCNKRNNISHWWNDGLDHARYHAVHDGAVTWDVAILNDDAVVPYGWFDAVTQGMRDRDSIAGCSGGHDVTLRIAEAVPLDMRLQGFAFVLSQPSNIRANEDLHWYFTDDYIDWESRKLGGMTMVRGFPVDHRFPNGQITSELSALIAQDAQTFVDLYGRRPW